MGKGIGFKLFLISTLFYADAMALQKIPSQNAVLVEFGQAKELAVPAGVPQNMLVWNIYKAKRPELLPDLLGLGTLAQFAVLQETVLSRHVAQEMSRLEGFNWQNALSFFQRNGDGTGVVTGSRYGASAVNFMRSQAREPIVNTPKISVITEYAIAGRDEKLVIANIHALNFVPNSKFGQQLADLADLLAHHKGPMIWAGDFNTHHNDRYLRLAKVAESLGLHIQPLRDDQRFLKLDHVLVRGVKVLDAAVLSTYRSSDHLPVMVRFVL